MPLSSLCDLVAKVLNNPDIPEGVKLSVLSWVGLGQREEGWGWADAELSWPPPPPGYQEPSPPLPLSLALLPTSWRLSSL